MSKLISENGKETYTDLSCNLCNEVRSALQPILDKYIALDCSRREIGMIILNAVPIMISESIMRNTCKLLKHERVV